VKLQLKYSKLVIIFLLVFVIGPHKRRNRLKQWIMNGIVYVKLNSKLTKEKEDKRKSFEKSKLDDISSTVEWFMKDVKGKTTKI